jgi:hypothetical protein
MVLWKARFVPGEDLIEQELMLNRFNRLIGEVMRGAITRNSFQPWEVEILMDLENCQLERRRRLEILRQYQRAVERQMTHGPGPPMKLSQFLILRERRREALQSAAGGVLEGDLQDSSNPHPLS